MGLLFEWDRKKARLNIKTQGVSFNEASTAFRDPVSQTIDDPLHSEDEDRFVLIGRSIQGRLLVIVHTDRGERIRIISTRVATKKERLRYEENEE
ncbi:MAG: BrnT family toxin [Deltaproteobacteria bacterium]|nr:BrnT family toxin [Deltaproteobacteria bacterium]